MDPFTALSVVGNIVQFVDFALKIVSKGNHIYHSEDGSLTENRDLELVTNDLLVMQTKMQLSLVQTDGTIVSHTDEPLLKLLSASSQVAETLLKRLNSVKASGKFRRWNSLRQAVKSVCSKPEVDSLARRLTDFRDELQTRVLVTLSSRFSESNVEVQQMLEDIQHECAAISGRVADLSNQISSYKHDEPIGNPHHSSHVRCRGSCSSGPDGLPPTYPDSAQLEESEIHQAVLKAFKYSSMDARHKAILGAHTDTFRWILEENDGVGMPWDNFMNWLRSERELYWLKGKAASGKSTLVKFLVQHQEVKKSLEIWSGDHKLVQASFFFYALGTPMQKSQTGLLMSLVHQILSHDKSLAKLGVPELREEITSMNPDDARCLQCSWKIWTLPDLCRTLDNILMQAVARCKICLFVDGVDEFAGNHAELAAFLVRLTTHNNVKICVSGRPLPSLEYEFMSRPCLQLQDLTRRDIYIYVRDRLNSHRHFVSICQKDRDAADRFIERAVRVSSGVFLWVYLVTNSLIEGLTNYDTMDDLQHRLNELPTELDTLYRSMLQSISPKFYKSQASVLLQIVYQYRFPMSSLAISFASDLDQGVAASTKISTIDYDEAMQRIDAITHRIKSRCRGLIEVNNVNYSHYTDKMVDYPPRPDKVQFLHLTVREFLEQPEVWREINSWTEGSDFNVNVACLRGIVTLTKKTLAFHGWRKPLVTLLGSAMSFAREAEHSLAHNCRSLVDEIDEVGQHVFSPGREKHWTSDLTIEHDSLCSHYCWCPNTTFVWYCIQKGLLQYVESVPDGLIQSLNAKLGGLLLVHAIGASKEQRSVHGKSSTDESCDWREHFSSPEAWDQFSGYSRPYPPMVKLLFDKGLDPNEKTSNTTPWTEFVGHMVKQKTTKPSIAIKLIDTTRMFILYGADLLHCPSLAICNGKTQPVADTLYALFGHLPQQLTSDLFNMIRERTRGPLPGMGGLQGSLFKNQALADRTTKPRPNQKRRRKSRGLGG